MKDNKVQTDEFKASYRDENGNYVFDLIKVVDNSPISFISASEIILTPVGMYREDKYSAENTAIELLNDIHNHALDKIPDFYKIYGQFDDRRYSNWVGHTNGTGKVVWIEYQDEFSLLRSLSEIDIISYTNKYMLVQDRETVRLHLFDVNKRVLDEDYLKHSEDW